MLNRQKDEAVEWKGHFFTRLLSGKMQVDFVVVAPPMEQGLDGQELYLSQLLQEDCLEEEELVQLVPPSIQNRSLLLREEMGWL
jgi:hypothetical protein